MRLDDNPFACQYKKEDIKAEGFQIWHLYGLLSNDITAMKGLTYMCALCVSGAVNTQGFVWKFFMSYI